MVEHIKKVVSQMIEEHDDSEKNLFRKMVPLILKKGLDKVDTSMFDEDTKNKLMDAVGDECFKKGKMEEAKKAFMRSKNKSNLVKMGDFFKNNQMTSDAIDTYQLAEAYEKVNDLGEACLEDGDTTNAARAFIITKNSQMLIRVADECVKRERLDLAIEVYGAYNDKSKLSQLGEKCLKGDDLENAAKAFEAAENKNGLNRVGDALLKKENVGLALKVYEAAGNEMMLEFIRKNFNM